MFDRVLRGLQSRLARRSEPVTAPPHTVPAAVRERRQPVGPRTAPPRQIPLSGEQVDEIMAAQSVSYTHLTLPTKRIV